MQNIICMNKLLCNIAIIQIQMMLGIPRNFTEYPFYLQHVTKIRDGTPDAFAAACVLISLSFPACTIYNYNFKAVKSYIIQLLCCRLFPLLRLKLLLTIACQCVSRTISHATGKVVLNPSFANNVFRFKHSFIQILRLVITSSWFFYLIKVTRLYRSSSEIIIKCQVK